MPIRFAVRHRSPYRSRLYLPLLKGDASFCHEVEKRIDLFPAVDSLEARPHTGSLILLHSQDFADFTAVVAAIEKLREQFIPPPLPSPTTQDREKTYHVSGFSLLCSGLYLLYYSVKRAVTATASLSFFQLPTLITLGLAWPIQRQAIDNLQKTGRPDMGMISTGLLYYSLFAGNILAAYTIFWLFNLSSWLESRIQKRTRQTIRDMLLARKENVWLQQQDGAEIEVAASTLQPGDRIILRLGSVVPVDGVICQGHAFIDESMLTGEAQPVARGIGARILSGTVICGGEIVAVAEKTGEETRLAGIVRMVEVAENDPGDMQRFSHRISRAMVPFSVGLAAVGFLITGNIMQAMALFVIGCPCVLRLSSSVAVSSQVARASREGLLIKGGRYLELTARMDTLVIDKTGTLTSAEGQQLDIIPFDNRFDRKYLLQLAASMQQIWPHPAGRQLQIMAKEEGLELLSLQKTMFTVGAGVRAMLNEEEILFGSDSFLSAAGVYFSSDQQRIINQNRERGSRLFLARDRRCLALFTVSHQLRGGEMQAIANLRAGGIRHLVLLSGDCADGVETVGRELGFDLVLAGQSPEEKANWITAYRQENPAAIIGMAGDGINDTPAFAAADIGIAIADGGADVTVEYGDIVVQYGGITQIARLQQLAQQTDRRIKRGYTAAIGLNSLAMAGTATGLLSPLAGALFHNGITLAVVSYSATGYNQKKNFY